MAKPGDKVRFLNSIGGGTITRIDGKTAFVEDEDGFESPILIKDLVVVLPAGHVGSPQSSVLMFNQQAFDEGRKTELHPEVAEEKKIPEAALPKAEDTSYGDDPTIILAFEPRDIKRLSSSGFNVVVINDSNFKLDFVFLRRSSEEHGWTKVYAGNIEPNELMDVAVLSLEELPAYEKVALQAVIYKEDKIFEIQPAVSVIRKLDLTKFHKFHCFKNSLYFDSPVIEYPLLVKGKPVTQLISTSASEATTATTKDIAKELSKKYKTDIADYRGHQKNKESNAGPFKKLPLIEVDLHIGELLDTTVGMEAKDMLEKQLSEVRKTMEAHKRRIGQKIVFIHGKGDGVLRKAVIDLLKKEYPYTELQDASFREYGFGATLVTIRQPKQ